MTLPLGAYAYFVVLLAGAGHGAAFASSIVGLSPLFAVPLLCFLLAAADTRSLGAWAAFCSVTLYVAYAVGFGLGHAAVDSGVVTL